MSRPRVTMPTFRDWGGGGKGVCGGGSLLFVFHGFQNFRYTSFFSYNVPRGKNVFFSKFFCNCFHLQFIDLVSKPSCELDKVNSFRLCLVAQLSPPPPRLFIPRPPPPHPTVLRTFLSRLACFLCRNQIF